MQSTSSARLEFPGLDTDIRSLLRLSDDELVERLQAFALALRSVGSEALAELAELANLPLGEVVASPFGLRAVAMGVQVGATTVHRELRQVQLWPQMEQVADPDHGIWSRGKLHIGKYQSFSQDAPFAIFDPNHGPKWGPHELMHRAVGFYWSESPSRWELYLASRLNELIPVVLWYGPDQLARLDEDRFERHETPVEALVDDAHWLVERERELERRIRRTLEHFRHGLTHFCAELEAIDVEMKTGRRVATPRRCGGALLDASSDATAYVAAHWDRLMHVHEAVCTLSGDARLDDIGAYRDRVESAFEGLLCGTITLDSQAVLEKRERRHLWDLGLRRALCQEGAEQDGLREVAHDQLADGVASVFPRSTQILDAEMPDWVEQLAAYRGLWRRAPLAQRMASWWDEGRLDLARLEAAIAGARRDDAVEHLGDEPDLERGHVIASSAVEIVECELDVLPLHAGESEAMSGPATYLVVGVEQDVVVAEATESMLDVLSQCASEKQEITALPQEDVQILLELGALRYITAAR